MKKTPTRKNLIKLAIALIVPQLAGMIGSLFTFPAIPVWYAGLIKPTFSPPSWFFGPVWVSLFLLMGIAAFIVWKKGLNAKNVKIALSIFIVQLVFNSLWSVLFFGLHNPRAAFIEIIVLILTIIATMVSFSKVSKAAAILLIPYLLWVGFASYLNFSIWELNSLNRTVCTMEAKICPDGSAVGRSGPDCEFAKCPEKTDKAGIKTATDEKTGLTFEYPEKITASFISTASWPPEISTREGKFSCLEDSSGKPPIAGSGLTAVNGHEYCVRLSGEGAAGSTYIDYYYSAERNGEVVSIHFVLRYPQCANYDDPKKSQCEAERNSFSVDALADGIFSSIKPE